MLDAIIKQFVPHAMLIRFTEPSDIVLSVGVETTLLPEVVLDRVRPLERFLADKSGAHLDDRLKTGHLKAFNMGFCQLRGTS